MFLFGPRVPQLVRKKIGEGTPPILRSWIHSEERVEKRTDSTDTPTDRLQNASGGRLLLRSPGALLDLCSTDRSEPTYQWSCLQGVFILVFWSFLVSASCKLFFFPQNLIGLHSVWPHPSPCPVLCGWHLRGAAWECGGRRGTHEQQLHPVRSLLGPWQSIGTGPAGARPGNQQEPEKRTGGSASNWRWGVGILLEMLFF